MTFTLLPMPTPDALHNHQQLLARSIQATALRLSMLSHPVTTLRYAKRVGDPHRQLAVVSQVQVVLNALHQLENIPQR